MNIILRNFFRILRSGAFGEKDKIEQMSAFKWHRLYRMAEAQHVTHIFACGVELHREDDGMNLPDDIANLAKEILEGANILHEHTITEKEVRFTNRMLNNRLKHLIDTELHNIDTSVESLDLLEIIIFNITSMLNGGISLDGIIRLGKYLRTRGDKVDFVKIDTWIDRLHIRRMAHLQGSILTAVFGFEQDELPFMKKNDGNAFRLTVRSVSHLAKDTAEEWESRRKEKGFVRNNSYLLRKNLSRSIRYCNYAPLETTSTFLANLGRSLSEIEE